MSDLISRKALIEKVKESGFFWFSKLLVIDALKKEESVPAEPQWIPCSERLPDKEYELYWTTHEDGSIVLHGYTKKNGFIYNWEVDDLELRKRQGGVVAWMLIPQPEPYKGE